MALPSCFSLVPRIRADRLGAATSPAVCVAARLAIGLAMGLVLGAAGCAVPPAPIEPLAAGSSDAGPAWPEPLAASDPLHRHLAVPLRTTPDGWLLSDPVGDGTSFDEALPSWNVRSQAGFTVEIRAAGGALEAPSPWLLIGDWALAEREDGALTAFEGGKVAVDVLRLTAGARTAELRFRGLDSTVPLAADDVRASIVLTDRTALDARVAEVRKEPWPPAVQLSVPARCQRRAGEDIGHRVCSPTSVAMVAAFHGADVETRAMAETLLDPHFDIFGNWNRAVQGAFTYGVPGRLVRVSSWEHVRSYLAAGLPVIASIRATRGQLAGAPYETTSGHLLVVTGLGPGGAVHVNDPAASFPIDVKRVYQRGEVETVWFANGGVAYVFEPRIEDALSANEARAGAAAR